MDSEAQQDVVQMLRERRQEILFGRRKKYVGTEKDDAHGFFVNHWANPPSSVSYDRQHSTPTLKEETLRERVGGEGGHSGCI